MAVCWVWTRVEMNSPSDRAVTMNSRQLSNRKGQLPSMRMPKTPMPMPMMASALRKEISA